MVRPRKQRRVDYAPAVTFFKPQAVPLSELEEVWLDADELETIRLTNIEGLNQADAAQQMDVHQSTLHRILVRAERKVADALVNGKAIRIQQEPLEKGVPRVRGRYRHGQNVV
ncbi:MAG: DUF134 domain-containing protein [Candidatus Woesearchaeota archaeon]